MEHRLFIRNDDTDAARAAPGPARRASALDQREYPGVGEELDPPSDRADLAGAEHARDRDPLEGAPEIGRLEAGDAEERHGAGAAVEIEAERWARPAQPLEHRLEVRARGLWLALRERQTLAGARQFRDCERVLAFFEADHVSHQVGAGLERPGVTSRQRPDGQGDEQERGRTAEVRGQRTARHLAVDLEGRAPV